MSIDVDAESCYLLTSNAGEVIQEMFLQNKWTSPAFLQKDKPSCNIKGIQENHFDPAERCRKMKKDHTCSPYLLFWNLLGFAQCWTIWIYMINVQRFSMLTRWSTQPRLAVQSTNQRNWGAVFDVQDAHEGFDPHNIGQGYSRAFPSPAVCLAWQRRHDPTNPWGTCWSLQKDTPGFLSTTKSKCEIWLTWIKLVHWKTSSMLKADATGSSSSMLSDMTLKAEQALMLHSPAWSLGSLTPRQIDETKPMSKAGSPLVPEHGRW